MMNTSADAAPQRGTLRISRSRGRVTGAVIVLLGLWAVFVPLVGPFVGYTPGAAGPWSAAWAGFWLLAIPGVVLVVCGGVLVATGQRVAGIVAAAVAAAAGGWIAVGPALWAAVAGASAPVGGPVGGDLTAAEQIGMSSGLAVAVVLLAGLALGRFTVRGVRDVAAAEDEHHRRELRAERERGASDARSSDPEAPAHTDATSGGGATDVDAGRAPA